MIFLIKEITQLSNHDFRILWNDDKWSEFHLKDLQEKCPCARCQESQKIGQEDVRAKKISSVGNYALRIDFSSGCSRGVFTFQYLRTLNIKEAV